MKKAVSLILTVAIMITMANFCVYGSVDNDLILDVDFSNYNATATSLSDKTNNVTFSSEGTPEAMQYAKSDGSSFPYAKFSGTSKQHISVGIQEGADLLKNKKNTTIEMWMYTTRLTDYQKFFMISSSVATNASWRGEINSGGIRQYRKSNVATSRLVPLSNFTNQWFHYLITRSFDETLQTTTYQTYLNGVLQDTKVIEQTDGINDGNNICFGGATWNGATDYFSGGISTIKMYDDVLSESYVKSIYDSSKDLYQNQGTLQVNSVTFINYNNELEISQIFGADNIYIEASLTNTSRSFAKKYIMAAAIYKNGVLKDIKLKNASLAANSTIANDLLIEKIDADINTQIKVFIWSDDDGSKMMPFCNPYPLSYISAEKESL